MGKTPEKRQGPLHIPLPLGKLVEGLLQVDPKKLPSRQKPAIKKKAVSRRKKK